MKRGKHDTLSGYSFFMESHRYSAAVIANRAGAVCLQDHADLRAEACQVLIDCIVYDLIY